MIRTSSNVYIDDFKGNAFTGKYQCILVDPQKHRILDILPDRPQSHLDDYWRSIPRKERWKVKAFVCDMWLLYVELASPIVDNSRNSMIEFLKQEDVVLKNLRNMQKRYNPGEKKS